MFDPCERLHRSRYNGSLGRPALTFQTLRPIFGRYNLGIWTEIWWKSTFSPRPPVCTACTSPTESYLSSIKAGTNLRNYRKHGGSSFLSVLSSN